MVQIQNNSDRSNLIVAMVDEQQVSMSYPQAFALAHFLYRQEEVTKSFSLLQTMLKQRPDDRPTKLLLARCLARQSKFQDSLSLLQDTFRDDASLAAQFQDAFVLRAVGFMKGALEGLSEIVKKHEELPTASLMLGDLWAHCGNSKNAVACWKLAAQRDREFGHVAYSAKVQVMRVKRHVKRA